MGKKDKFSAKKTPISGAWGNSSNRLLMENLQSVNACLVKEVEECRRDIECIRVHLMSVMEENDIFHGIQHDVFTLAVSSTLHECASLATIDMAVALKKEKILKRKFESIAKEVNVKDKELLALVKDNDEKKKELTQLKENIGAMKQTKECRTPRWNLFRSFPAVGAFVATAGAALVIFSIIFKK